MKSSFTYFGQTVAPIFLCALPGTLYASTQPKGGGATQLPLTVESLNGDEARQLPTSVQWRDREYDITGGIDVVMTVIRDSVQSYSDRHQALVELERLGRHLKGRSCMDELAAIYDSAGELKRAILICFKASEDPRAIRAFLRVLDNESDIKLRLSAAGGLAQWNVRRGVAELVGLLDSDAEVPQPSRMPYVRDNALDLLRTKNRLKGWGFRDEEIWKPIESRTDLNAQEKADLYVAQAKAEIKKWWQENEHRFPDWKLGDPLPLIEPGKESNR